MDAIYKGRAIYLKPVQRPTRLDLRHEFEWQSKLASRDSLAQGSKQISTNHLVGMCLKSDLSDRDGE